MADTRSRKWCFTLNNPVEHGWNDERLEALCKALNIDYCVKCDEIGLEDNTPHFQGFLYRSEAIRFSTLQNAFEKCAHLEMAKGTCQQNFDYVTKGGKWKDTEKSKTTVQNTLFVYGEMPFERQGARNDLVDVRDMIIQGCTNSEIFEEMPNMLLHTEKLDKARQAILRDKYRAVFRQLKVHYLWGESRSGKTSSVMNKHGYCNCYRVTDYQHPFDGYEGQSVMIFDEFRSQLPIADMLNYLDGYPLELPARFNNHTACYEEVYLISNIPLERQYTDKQREEPETFKAFTNRIQDVKAMYKTEWENDNKDVPFK